MLLIIYLLLSLLLFPSVAIADLQLDWVPSPVDENHSAPTSYRIYRRTVDTPMEMIREVDASTTQAIDASLTVGVEYCYQLTAVNSAGASGLSNEACAINRADVTDLAIQVPANRTVLVSRRATDGSSLISMLANASDVVSVNDSQLAPAAAIVVNAPPSREVLISKRATDGSSIVSILINNSQVLMVNGKPR